MTTPIIHHAPNRDELRRELERLLSYLDDRGYHPGIGTWYAGFLGQCDVVVHLLLPFSVAFVRSQNKLRAARKIA